MAKSDSRALTYPSPRLLLPVLDDIASTTVGRTPATVLPRADKNAARDFARKRGVPEHRAQLIWDGVALNSTPSIGLHKEVEVALCTAGIGLGWGGWGYEALTEAQLTPILEQFQRLGMKQGFTRAD